MNSERHILSAFDRDLETVQAMVVKMGGMVESAINDAANALENRDDELAEDVRRRDKAIDALELQINEEAARLIALRAPTATVIRPSPAACARKTVPNPTRDRAQSAPRARRRDGRPCMAMEPQKIVATQQF
jgi:hypothetical protein